MQPNPNGSPIEYPTVTTSRGVVLTVKFSNRSLYRLDKAGIDLQTFGEKLKGGRVSVSMIYDILAACISHSPAYSAEDLSEEVTTADATRAVIEAMGKVQPPTVVKLQEPAAKSEQLQ